MVETADKLRRSRESRAICQRLLGSVACLTALVTLILTAPKASARPRWAPGGHHSQQVGRLPFPEETKGEEETIEDDIHRLRGESAALEKGLLKKMGEFLVQQNLWQCNIFGGTGSCSAMTIETGYKEQCPKQSNQVDCALRGGAEEAFSGDFYGEIGTAFNDSGLPPCESCMNKLRQFWCGQAVPTCGTFDNVIDTLLPAMQEILSTREKGNAVLKKMMPQLLHSLALGLPSQELCQQLLDRCTCGNTGVSFGEVLDMIEMTAPSTEQAGGTGDGKSKDGLAGEAVAAETGMSPAMAEDLFEEVRNWKPCDVFVPANTDNFMGMTDWVNYDQGSNFRVPADKPCSWCNGHSSPSMDDKKREAQALFERVVVSQMARSISSMMRSGLQHVLDAAGARDPRGGTEQDREEAAQEAVKEGKQEWNWTDASGGVLGGAGHDADGASVPPEEGRGGDGLGHAPAPGPAVAGQGPRGVSQAPSPGEGLNATKGGDANREKEEEGASPESAGKKDEKSNADEETGDGEAETHEQADKGEDGNGGGRAGKKDGKDDDKKDENDEDKKDEEKEGEGSQPSGGTAGLRTGTEGGGNNQEREGQGAAHARPEDGTGSEAKPEAEGHPRSEGQALPWEHQQQQQEQQEQQPEERSREGSNQSGGERDWGAAGGNGEHVSSPGQESEYVRSQSETSTNPGGHESPDETQGEGRMHEGEPGDHMGGGGEGGWHDSMHSSMHGDLPPARPEESNSVPLHSMTEHTGGSVFMTVFWIFAGVGVVGVGLLFAKRWQETKKRTQGESYIPMQEMSYQPPVL